MAKKKTSSPGRKAAKQKSTPKAGKAAMSGQFVEFPEPPDGFELKNSSEWLKKAKSGELTDLVGPDNAFSMMKVQAEWNRAHQAQEFYKRIDELVRIAGIPQSEVEAYQGTAQQLMSHLEELAAQKTARNEAELKRVAAGAQVDHRADVETAEQQATEKGSEKSTKAKKPQKRFTFPVGEARWNGKDLGLPTGPTIDILQQLVKSFGAVVGHMRLLDDDITKASQAGESLRKAIFKINEALKHHKVPHKITSKRGVGYKLF